MIPGFKEIKKGTKLITKKQKLLHKSLQDGVLDIDAVENFFEEYDHHGSTSHLVSFSWQQNQVSTAS